MVDYRGPRNFQRTLNFLSFPGYRYGEIIEIIFSTCVQILFKFFHCFHLHVLPCQAHEDGGYIKLVIKEDCIEGVPGPVQRVLRTFHTEVWIQLIICLI